MFGDRIEDRDPGKIPGRENWQSIRFEQVAQVAIRRGLVWSTLVIESTGGNSIAIDDLDKNVAEQAKREIERRLDVFRSRKSEAPNPPAPEALSEELERLARLREQGHLSEDEFAEAKRALLGLR